MMERMRKILGWVALAAGVSIGFVCLAAWFAKQKNEANQRAYQTSIDRCEISTSLSMEGVVVHRLLAHHKGATEPRLLWATNHGTFGELKKIGDEKGCPPW